MDGEGNTINEEKQLIADETSEKEKQITEDRGEEGDGKENDEKKDEENEKKTGEVEKMKKQLEESQKSGPAKIRVPIGGIKIPGFLRSLSRDNKNKEHEVAVEEGTDLLEAKPNADETIKSDEMSETELQRWKRTVLIPKWQWLLTKPYPKPKTKADEPSGSFLDRLPAAAVAVLPKRFIRSDKKNDVEAVVEEEKPKLDEDGMESVKLDDGSETGTIEKEKLEEEEDIPKILPLWCSPWVHKFYYEAYHTRTRLERILYPILLCLVLLIVLISIFTSGSNQSIRPPVIDGKLVTQTQCGQVEGILKEDIFEFRDIPYAAPPIKERRWKPAQPLNSHSLCWNETLSGVKNHSKKCWQQLADDKIDGDENCLTLDIYSPDVRYMNPNPVVVLIDAATLLGGPPGVLVPTRKIVKEQEIVFVRPNFRLGVLGFLAASALSTAVHPPSSGNYGLTDIIVALQWVQNNIIHFGGDPKQVTLLGHRAGATLVTAVAASPAAKNLFARAWASSGSSVYPGEDQTNSTLLANRKYIESLCSSPDLKERLRCLLGKDVESLMDHMEDSWRPGVVDLPTVEEKQSLAHHWLVLDGNLLQSHLWSSDTKWVAPLVIGTTAQSEASPKLYDLVHNTAADTKQEIQFHVKRSMLGKLELANQALERYNATWKGLASMVTDLRTACSLLTMARACNLTYYIATRSRNHTDFGDIADVDTDMSAIMGSYLPHNTDQQIYVKNLQRLFYDYAKQGVQGLPKERPSSQAFIAVSEKVEWVMDQPNCNFWVSKGVVPKYSRKD